MKAPVQQETVQQEILSPEQLSAQNYNSMMKEHLLTRAVRTEYQELQYKMADLSKVQDIKAVRAQVDQANPNSKRWVNHIRASRQLSKNKKAHKQVMDNILDFQNDQVNLLTDMSETDKQKLRLQIRKEDREDQSAEETKNAAALYGKLSFSPEITSKLDAPSDPKAPSDFDANVSKVLNGLKETSAKLQQKVDVSLKPDSLRPELVALTVSMNGILKSWQSIRLNHETSDKTKAKYDELQKAMKDIPDLEKVLDNSGNILYELRDAIKHQDNVSWGALLLRSQQNHSIREVTVNPKTKTLSSNGNFVYKAKDGENNYVIEQHSANSGLLKAYQNYEFKSKSDLICNALTAENVGDIYGSIREIMDKDGLPLSEASLATAMKKWKDQNMQIIKKVSANTDKDANPDPKHVLIEPFMRLALRGRLTHHKGKEPSILDEFYTELDSMIPVLMQAEMRSNSQAPADTSDNYIPLRNAAASMISEKLNSTILEQRREVRLKDEKGNVTKGTITDASNGVSFYKLIKDKKNSKKISGALASKFTELKVMDCLLGKTGRNITDINFHLDKQHHIVDINGTNNDNALSDLDTMSEIVTKDKSGYKLNLPYIPKELADSIMSIQDVDQFIAGIEEHFGESESLSISLKHRITTLQKAIEASEKAKDGKIVATDKWDAKMVSDIIQSPQDSYTKLYSTIRKGI
ncbi:MAG: hypothetical protein LKF52_04750 [Butyrivibrio sp.]|nr:hypothetical protein [Butyrivibrio sp.]